MLSKKCISLTGLVVILFIILTTGLWAAAAEPFFMGFSVPAPQALGNGVSGEIALTLTNTSEDTIQDITIYLPQDTKFLFGPNSHSQAGTLKPGEQAVIQEYLFDPEGISETGALTFMVDYTDSAGNHHTVEVKAVGKVEAPHE